MQRVMFYAGAREVIVDVLEFVEDANEFGVLLEHAGQPLSARLRNVPRQHWLRNVGAPRPRSLLWQNLRRLATAIGIVHAQGLVHGRITADAVMTDAAEIPDFQLTGFEWSLWLSADKAERVQARLNAIAEAVRSERYSFAEDWRAFGRLAAECLGAAVRSSGELAAIAPGDGPPSLSNAERALLKRLVAPTRLDNLEAGSISRAIDDIIIEAARSGSSRAGTFIVIFSQKCGLDEAVYMATDGEIATDEYPRQLDWARADLDGGATLLVPRAFEAASDRMQVVSASMVYHLAPMWKEGVAAWDVAVCIQAERRHEALRIGDQQEHTLTQRLEIATSVRTAVELRARLGPDALDWSGFADPTAAAPTSRTERVRQALLLVQVVESVIKALEVYPVEILATERDQGRRFAVLRAEPRNERDRAAAKLKLPETERALRRLFEDDQRDADGRWRLSLAASLGTGRENDTTATFVDVTQHKGRHALRFELDDQPPKGGTLFLRPERDTGTENAISRRLKNIKALTTREDLAEMLDDPWMARRTSRDIIDAQGQQDPHFLDLDEPKRKALLGLWSTSPGFNVVGPPEKAADARRMLCDLKERLAAFGLQLHEEKTRLIEFGRFAAVSRLARGEPRPESFAFLGFTHYCGRTRDGRFIVKHKTQSSRLTRKLTAIRQDARHRMHEPLTKQHRWYASILRGHYGYFGMPHNWRALNGFRQDVRRIWFNCLRRRSQRSRRMGWDWFEALTAHLPMPLPRITHPWTPRGSQCG